jgi:ubiquinone/menaquinone biosynthesis C-methylase UbiE
MGINTIKQAFWDGRATLGETAGTNDFVLKRIETDLLVKRVHPGSRVLDIGCGNGDTLLKLVEESGCTGVGVDFASEMISVAKSSCVAKGLADKVKFLEGHVPDLPIGLGLFDFVISERCLINLDDLVSQERAFRELMDHLTPGGTYLMIEDSFDGLEKLNEVRTSVQLEPIDPPWHNLFLREKEVAAWARPGCLLQEFVPFTSTYYFLSRVVYARLAKDRSEELRYDSEINLLAPSLPNLGDLGAVRLWVWRRQ